MKLRVGSLIAPVAGLALVWASCLAVPPLMEKRRVGKAFGSEFASAGSGLTTCHKYLHDTPNAELWGQMKVSREDMTRIVRSTRFVLWQTTEAWEPVFPAASSTCWKGVDDATFAHPNEKWIYSGPDMNPAFCMLTWKDGTLYFYYIGQI